MSDKPQRILSYISLTIHKLWSNYRYPPTIVLDFTAHLVLKNDKCARINYRQ